MSNVAEYEVIDSERVIVRMVDEEKLRMKQIYHMGTSGILCNDFTTFVDFNDAEEVVFPIEESEDA